MVSPRRYTPEEVRYLKDHIGLLPLQEIAGHIGHTVASVQGKAMAMALPVRCLGITAEEAGWIISLALDGMPVETIAAKFGLPVKSLQLFIDFRRRECPCL